MSDINITSGNCAFNARIAVCARPSGLNASLAHSVLSGMGVTGKRASVRIPSATHFAVSSNNKSIDRRSTPGIEGTSSRWPVPGRTNTG